MNFRNLLPLILLVAAACAYVIENNDTQPKEVPTPIITVQVEYDRKLYKHWTDEDKDCQDTRQEVLISESIDPVVLDDKGCRVISGRWYDLFTDNTYTNPNDLDIDHIVPLKEAHISGAHSWTAERKEQYANDLSNPNSLIAVSKSVNRSKGAKDIAKWLPPNKAFRCEYIRRWVAVKEAWSMTMDVAETDVVETLLEGCQKPN